MTAGKLHLTVVDDTGTVVTRVEGAVEVTTPDVDDPDPPRGMDVGLSVKPELYGQWYPQFPAARYGRVFVPVGGGPPTWPKFAAFPATVTRIGVSWKDRVPAAQIVKFADGLPPGRHLDLTWRHEPEPDWPVADFRAGWRELHDALNGHPNRDRIDLVNIHTLWASRHKQGIDWRAWMLPGIADVEGWDCYRDTAFDAYEPAESLLGLPYLAADEFNTRWKIPELGSTLCHWDTTGVGRGRWYLDCVRFAGDHGCEAVGFWCSTNGSGGLDYRPVDAPTAASWTASMTDFLR